MTPEEIIQKCSDLNIILFEDSKKGLGYYAPAGAMKEDMLNQLEENKDKLLKLVKENHLIITYSKVLEKNIALFWKGDDPKVIYLDRVIYELNEIRKIRSLGEKTGLKAIHEVKKSFLGRIEEC